MPDGSADMPKPTPGTAPKKGTISRRKFLHVSAGAAAATAAGVIAAPDAHTTLEMLAQMGHKPKVTEAPKQPGVENKEKEPMAPKVTMIDAISGSKSDEMLARVMGRTYLPEKQLAEEFGENYKEHWDKVVGKYPQALFMQFADGMGYQKHGEKVSQVMRDMWQKDGQTNAEIEIKPLQDILDASSITHTVNKKGDEGIEINFDPQKIITMLKDDPNKVVNGSFQIGEVGVFKHIAKREIGSDTELILDDEDGNVYPGATSKSISEDDEVIFLSPKGERVAPVSKEAYQKSKKEDGKIQETTETSINIEGAYTKEKALQNLPKVFEVCNSYPDKLFVFAAGNEGEDLRDAREQLKDTWPNNVLFVGQWTEEERGEFTYVGPKYSVQGADIYLNNEALGIADGSSFSTPVIAAKASELFARGDTMEQIKEKLFAATRSVEIQPEEIPYNVNVFDPQLLEE